MNNYQKTLQSVGIGFDDLSVKLKQMVSEHEEAAEQLNDDLEKLSKMDEGDPEYDELRQEIQETEETLLEHDDELCAAIKKFSVDRIKVQKMQDAKKAKKESQNNYAPPKQDIPTTITTTQGQSTIVANPAIGVQNNKAVEQKGDGGNWILWTVLGVAGLFFGAQYFKNK
jgi:DNA repair ATPase RecN